MALEQVQGGIKRPPRDMREQMERYRQERIEAGCAVKDWIEGLQEVPWLPLEEESWRDAWETLVRLSVPFGNDGAAFLRSLVLSHETDFLERKSERVTLATLHAAKGLEFPVVFIAGCEDLLLPCQVGAQAADLAEERRLFYVGMTRACRLLHLTWARSRFLYGERRSSAPSRFLQDLPRQRITHCRVSKQDGKRGRREDPQPSLFKQLP
jgi:superfamily I DNA/RNA helicase